MSQRVYLQLEDDGAPDFASKVVEILNSTLALAPDSPTSSLSEAAAALDSLYGGESTAGSFLWWFWDLIHDLARQVPHDSPEQDRLAAVVKALTCLPPRTVNLGEEWGDSDGPVVLWANLPMFANTFREKLDDGDPRASGEEHRKARRVNLEAYAARVMGLVGFVQLDTYAVWALVDALEGTLTPVRGGPDEVNSDPAAVEAYRVSSAAAWMIHAGHLLYGRDEEIPGATAGPLWKPGRKLGGTNGLCPRRWHLWKERFAAIRDAGRLVDERARKDAGDAVAAMDKIEKSHTSE